MSHYTAIAYFEGNATAEQSADFDAGSDIRSAKQWALAKALEGLTGVVYQDGQYLGEYDPDDKSLLDYAHTVEPTEKALPNDDYAEYQAYCDSVRTSGFPAKPMSFQAWLQVTDAVSL